MKTLNPSIIRLAKVIIFALLSLIVAFGTLFLLGKEAVDTPMFWISNIIAEVAIYGLLGLNKKTK